MNKMTKTICGDALARSPFLHTMCGVCVFSVLVSCLVRRDLGSRLVSYSISYLNSHINAADVVAAAVCCESENERQIQLGIIQIEQTIDYMI